MVLQRYDRTISKDNILPSPVRAVARALSMASRCLEKWRARPEIFAGVSESVGVEASSFDGFVDAALRDRQICCLQFKATCFSSGVRTSAWTRSERTSGFCGRTIAVLCLLLDLSQVQDRLESAIRIANHVMYLYSQRHFSASEAVMLYPEDRIKANAFDRSFERWYQKITTI